MYTNARIALILLAVRLLLKLINYAYTHSELLLLFSGTRVALTMIATIFFIQGSARRLIKAALQEAARKREMRYSDLTKIDKKVRRHFHDDITVIILFLNYDLLVKGAARGQPLSIRCALDY